MNSITSKLHLNHCKPVQIICRKEKFETRLHIPSSFQNTFECWKRLRNLRYCLYEQVDNTNDCCTVAKSHNCFTQRCEMLYTGLRFSPFLQRLSSFSSQVTVFLSVLFFSFSFSHLLFHCSAVSSIFRDTEFLMVFALVGQKGEKSIAIC